jgi:hypothetical protein
MGWMELIASLVDSLAWPVAIVAASALLRSKLVDLLPLIKRGKVGPSGFEWELFDEGREISENLEAEGAQLNAELEASEELQPSAEPPARADNAPLEAENEGVDARERRILERLQASRPDDLVDRDSRIESEQFARLAAISPSAAVLQRHAELERTIREVINGVRRLEGLEPEPWQLAGRKLELLTTDDDRALRWLKKVRNEVAHGSIDLNAALAFDFGRLAEQVESNVLRRTLLAFERITSRSTREDSPTASV